MVIEDYTFTGIRNEDALLFVADTARAKQPIHFIFIFGITNHKVDMVNKHVRLAFTVKSFIAYFNDVFDKKKS